MEKSTSNPYAHKSSFKDYTFASVILNFNGTAYQVSSVEIEQMNCSWLGPHSSIVRLNMPDGEFERMYKSYIGNQGWSANITISIKMLEGEAPVLLEKGYIAECENRNVLIAVDLPPQTEKKFEQHINFRDYLVSEDVRREEIQRTEADRPYLQRFRIAMEED